MGFIHDYPSDKPTSGAWSHDGVVNALYPITNIDDDQPWNPVKFTTNPSIILRTFPAAQRVDLVLFTNCTFDAGATVTVEMNGANAWPGALVSPVTVPTVGEDGFPGDPFVDVTKNGAYLIGGRQYLAIRISGQTSPLSLGNVRISAVKRTIPTAFLASDVPAGFNIGRAVDEDHPIVRHRTMAGVLVGVSRGTRYEASNGSITCGEAGWSALRSLERAAFGGLNPFTLIPNDAINEGSLVVFTEKLSRRSLAPGAYEVPIAWEPIARGLRP